MGFYDYDELLQAIGRRLRAFRKERGDLSLREFGTKYGWAFNQWHLMELGKRISFPTLVRAADTLNVTLEELLDQTVKLEGPATLPPPILEHPPTRSKKPEKAVKSTMPVKKRK